MATVESLLAAPAAIRVPATLWQRDGAGQARFLDGDYKGLETLGRIRRALRRDFRHRIAVVTSFGTESAVLLYHVSRVARDCPVLFVDTGKHFAETLAYGEDLTARLGLSDVRIVSPRGTVLAVADPSGRLHAVDPDRCCSLRKAQPLRQALAPFDAWISGRKRYQNTDRQSLRTVEWDGSHFKVNPLVDWSADEVAAFIDFYDLPRHPLLDAGYASVGCAPCTAPVLPGEDPRAGRWRGLAKTECGIHRAVPQN